MVDTTIETVGIDIMVGIEIMEMDGIIGVAMDGIMVIGVVMDGIMVIGVAMDVDAMVHSDM